MPKHLSQQRQRHIERQQNVDWYQDLKTIDIRTASEEEIKDRIKHVKNPKVRQMIKKLRELVDKGQ